MADIEHWLASHTEPLRGIAFDLSLDPQAVQAVALLVLAGLDDQEIVQQFRSNLLLPNGRHDPLEAVPQAISEVRALVARD